MISRTVARVMRRAHAQAAPRVVKGRVSKWVPKVMDDTDQTAALEFMGMYATTSAAAERVQTNFRLFLSLNEMASGGEALMLWVGQCVVAGLAPGTIDTYATYLRRLMPRDDPVARSVFKAIQKQHADAETTHAADILDADLIRIINRVADPVMQAGLFILLVAGLRPNGLRWLRRKQAKARLPADDAEVLIHIQIRVDKNAWKRVHRNELSLPRSWTAHMGFDKFPAQVQAYLSEGDPEERLFWGLSNGAINKALAAVATLHHLPCATGTTFRRAYMNRLFNGFDGDLEKIRPWTLHHSKMVTKAHYYQWKGEAATPGEAASSSDEDDEVEED